MNQSFLTAGQKLARVFAKTFNEIQAGVSLAEVEEKANEYIEAEEGKAGFKMVKNYNWATCINIDAGVVHGIPDETIVKLGDVVSLDMGLFYDGWYADMAYTKEIRNPKHEILKDKIDKFLETGERALGKAIKQVKPGNRVGDISKAIEEAINEGGYRVISRLTGHGIGKKLHQPPKIPGVLSEPIEETPKLKENMGLAIEIIYTQGKPGIKTTDDGWTITTQDGKISALFEKSVLVTSDSVKIITPYLFPKDPRRISG